MNSFYPQEIITPGKVGDIYTDTMLWVNNARGQAWVVMGLAKALKSPKTHVQATKYVTDNLKSLELVLESSVKRFIVRALQ